MPGRQQTVAQQPSALVDVRLVPAALTGWLVTAAGIVWPVGAALASLSGLVTAISGGLLLRLRTRPAQQTRLPAIAVALLAVGVIGTGYGLAVALRANAVRHHPITAAYGRAARVLVTPSESALPVGSSRLLFRATLHRLGADEIVRPRHGFRPGPRLRRGDGRSAGAVRRPREPSHPPRSDGGGSQREGCTPGRRSRAGAPGRLCGARPVRGRRTPGAAGPASRDAPGAGAR